MKNKRTVFCFIIYNFLFNCISFGQNEMFNKDTLLAEIDVLFSSIEEIHPDMYAVLSKEEFNKELDKLKSNIKSEMNVFEFYKYVVPLVTKLGDGHTSVSFPYDKLKQSKALLFPFTVDVNTNDSTITILKDYTEFGNTIPIGAKVLSINKVPIKKLVTKMMEYCSGERFFFKLARLDDLFTPLLYTLYQSGEFIVEYDNNREKEIIIVKGIPYSERYKHKSKKNNTKPTENYTFKHLSKKNIGIIDFRIFDELEKFKVFLDSVFKVLQKENINNLIIDIRKNRGGYSELGDELFQYISPCPFAQFGKMIVKYSDKQKEIFKIEFDEKIEEKNGIKVYKNNTLVKLRKNKLRYDGDVYLLISHNTFSSAGSFSWAFKHFKMGAVIGEESGGMAVCFGDIIPLRLPYTKLNCVVSYRKFYQYGASDENVHGTIPDYKVNSKKALEFTIDLIRKSTN